MIKNSIIPEVLALKTYTLYLFRHGITKGNISLVVYGEQSFNGYDYMFNPENVQIDSEGNITFAFGEQTKPEESYVIQ